MPSKTKKCLKIQQSLVDDPTVLNASRSTPARGAGAPNEEGTIVVWALLMVVLTTGMVISHSTFLKANKRNKTVRHVHGNLGTAFAKSGSTEVLNWFRRRSPQPITTFDPALDPEASPPRFETIDPSVGLVREFEIQGNLWGRYEVRYEDAVDIGSEVGGVPPGAVWEVGVRSYIYRIVDKTVPFNKKPNRLLSTKKVLSEFRFLKVTPPATAAVCCESPGSVDVGPSTRIVGNTGAAIAYQDPTVAAVATVETTTVDAAAFVAGSPKELPLSAYDASPGAILSMEASELKGFATHVVNKKLRLPSGQDRLILKDAIVYSKRSWLYTTPLELDNVLVYIQGDLVLSAEMTTPSVITGVLIVEGDATLDARLDFTGVLIVGGKLQVGKGANLVELQYNPVVIDKLRHTLNGCGPSRRSVPAGIDA